MSCHDFLNNFKHQAFAQETKSPFETEIYRENNLRSLINKLKGWVDTLSQRINLLPKKFKLEEICPSLSEFMNSTIDVPGQYFEVQFVHVDDLIGYGTSF